MPKPPHLHSPPPMLTKDLSLPFAFLLLSLLTSFSLPPQPPPPPQTLTLTPTRSPAPGRHIVRFYRYLPADLHRRRLEEAADAAGVDGWWWVGRNNPAAALPTDFAVVEVAGGRRHEAEVVGALRALGPVKDVWPDVSYSRGVSSSPPPVGCEGKRPGKIFTRGSFAEEEEEGIGNRTSGWWRGLKMERSQVTSMFGAEKLWAKGYTGAKVKMAIFDTGIRADHPHFRNIKERTNWTNEDTLNDNLGHGTFVAGVIAGQDAECLGFAPDVEIYAYRVFTDAQVSYTSWFLDAFNYAIAMKMDVLNLSIGGPDYLDFPFVEKVWELTANNIIMVSAIGNDGPLYGTLNNPADQSDVIGVGGIDDNDHIASFSSRGMSTWELPHGYGRVKPDVVAYGRDIMGSKISTGCKSLSGTSVASPVVAGVVCLLVSVIPESSRKSILNPASMKQALVEGATKLYGPHVYEQGAGRVNLLESFEILKSYQRRASIFPSILDYTDCPYFWPFCRQPLYAGAMPVIFNATILNGMGVIGYVESPPTWNPKDEVGNLLSIHFKYSDVIWPWTGYLALHMEIKEEGASFEGTIEGNVTVKVYSPPDGGRSEPMSSICALHLKVNVVPRPPRSKMVLWDQFHNIKYPPGYIPRDSLDVRNDILDWHGDHLHTNYHLMFNILRDAGYFIETLGSPLTCFDATRYGTLLMVDLEEEYFPEEIEKLKDDVVNRGLGLVVFSEWYNVGSMVKMRFFDDNTRSWWTPVTGGANIPAINELLRPFGIAFGGKILSGDILLDGEQIHYASGTDVVKFPGGGYIHSFPLQDNSESGGNMLPTPAINKVEASILGFLEVGKGRIAVYGDSNCLDSSHMVTNCYWLLKKILEFTSMNIRDPVLFADTAKREFPLYEDDNGLPSHRTDINFTIYSAVCGKELMCQSDSKHEVWGTKGYHFLMGRNRKLPGYATMGLGDYLNKSLETPIRNKQQPLKENISGTDFRNRIGSGMDFLHFYSHDEIDMPVPLSSQWLLPLFVVVACVLMFVSVWRMQQKRRRRRRASNSSRNSTSLV